MNTNIQEKVGPVGVNEPVKYTYSGATGTFGSSWDNSVYYIRDYITKKVKNENCDENEITLKQFYDYVKNNKHR